MTTHRCEIRIGRTVNRGDREDFVWDEAIGRDKYEVAGVGKCEAFADALEVMLRIIPGARRAIIETLDATRPLATPEIAKLLEEART